MVLAKEFAELLEWKDVETPSAFGWFRGEVP